MRRLNFDDKSKTYVGFSKHLKIWNEVISRSDMLQNCKNLARISSRFLVQRMISRYVIYFLLQQQLKKLLVSTFQSPYTPKNLGQPLKLIQTLQTIFLCLIITLHSLVSGIGCKESLIF